MVASRFRLIGQGCICIRVHRKRRVLDIEHGNLLVKPLPHTLIWCLYSCSKLWTWTYPNTMWCHYLQTTPFHVQLVFPDIDRYLIGASVSEPHTSEFNGGISLIYVSYVQCMHRHATCRQYARDLQHVPTYTFLQNVRSRFVLLLVVKWILQKTIPR